MSGYQSSETEYATRYPNALVVSNNIMGEEQGDREGSIRVSYQCNGIYFLFRTRVAARVARWATATPHFGSGVEVLTLEQSEKIYHLVFESRWFLRKSVTNADRTDRIDFFSLVVLGSLLPLAYA